MRWRRRILTRQNRDSTSSRFDLVDYALPMRMRLHKKRYERATFTGGSHRHSVRAHMFDLAALPVVIADASRSTGR